jgi:hypothetical protein
MLMGMLVGFVLGWAAAFIPCLWKKKPMPDLNWLTGGTAGRPCTDCTLAIRPGSMVWDIKAQTYIPREVCQSCDEARRQAAILASRNQTSPLHQCSSLMELISLGHGRPAGPS